MPSIIVVTGQTATGKTSLAVKLAKKNNGELINADSRQIYKHLDIVTGKEYDTTSKFNVVHELDNFKIGYYSINGVKIWLYDAVDPKIPFSSYDFVQLAKWTISDIASRGKVPIVIGGTYFYIKHLLYGYETENTPPDWDLRKELNLLQTEQIQDKLRMISFDTFAKMNHSDQNNPRRLIRRIEIALYNLNKQNKHSNTDNTIHTDLHLLSYIGLKHISTESIKNVIEKRVNKRMSEGALNEIEQLLESGYSSKDPGLQTIGYKELIEHVLDKKSLVQALSDWITHELQYSKRQLTFMKKDPNITWKTVGEKIT